MKLKTTALAAALAMGLVPAQQAAAQSMSEGLNMLQAALVNDFQQMGIPVSALFDLTLGQIAAIKSIVESDDNDSQKKGRIEAIIGN
ncbi:MAG: hypothetical protein AAF919_19320 [Pseudomonadota bacterium]